MESYFLLCFNSEYPDIGTFETFVQEALALHQIADRYTVKEIIDQACQRCDVPKPLEGVIEIHLAWLKTTCLQVIQELGQAYNKYKFDHAVEALFNRKNPSGRKFLATIQRLLYQYRLSNAYEPKEIVSEAYARGVQSINSGELIRIPEAWLKRTCHNVVRDFQRKQRQADAPKIDQAPWSSDDQVFSELMLGEDHQAVRLARKQLSHEEIEILSMRIDQKLTWQAIGEMVLIAEGRPLGENAARQRGFRALMKLRQHYNSIRDQVQVPEVDYSIDSYID